MTEKPPDLTKIIPGINPIIVEMHSQNDRGAAICGGVFLEQKLQEAIEGQWPPISRTVRERLFTGFGPLASFSAKIVIAHAMGVLATITKSDFDKIRLLRNDAAHIGTPFSFTSPEARKRLSGILLSRDFPADKFPVSPERNQFTVAVKCLSAYLFLQADWKSRFGHQTVMPAMGDKTPAKKRRVKSSSDSKRGS